MARRRFSYSTEGSISLTGATATTVLQIAAPSNQDVAVKGLSIAFDGTSGSATPGLVELVVQTQVLQGTPGSATARKDDQRIGTIQTTGKKWASGTTEPTNAGASAVLRDTLMHPQTGAEFRYWIDEEIIIVGGTWLGVRVTMPATVDCRACLFCEE